MRTNLLTVVLCATAFALLTGSGKSGVPSPVLGADFVQGTPSGKLCLNHSSEFAKGKLVHQPVGGKEPCNVALGSSENLEAWVTSPSGARATLSYDAAREVFVHGKLRQKGSTERYEGLHPTDEAWIELHVRVRGKVYTITRFGGASRSGVSLSAVVHPNGNTLGLRVTASYGDSMCPSNMHEVLATLDAKARRVEVVYNGFRDEHMSLHGGVKKSEWLPEFRALMQLQGLHHLKVYEVEAMSPLRGHQKSLRVVDSGVISSRALRELRRFKRLESLSFAYGDTLKVSSLLRMPRGMKLKVEGPFQAGGSVPSAKEEQKLRQRFKRGVFLFGLSQGGSQTKGEKKKGSKKVLPRR